MSHPSTPNGNGHRRPSAGSEDGWGPATAVYAASTRGVERTYAPAPAPERRFDEWTPAGPLPAREQRETRIAERRREVPVRTPAAPAAPAAPERGLPGWAACVLLVVIAGSGALIDQIASLSGKGGFNVGIVIASVVAILAVRRSHMFPVVIAPPIVYSAGAMFELYVKSGGLHNHKVILDAAANYLVYGFPAIASATAAVLIIAGIRLIIRK